MFTARSNWRQTVWTVSPTWFNYFVLLKARGNLSNRRVELKHFICAICLHAIARLYIVKLFPRNIINVTFQTVNNKYKLSVQWTFKPQTQTAVSKWNNTGLLYLLSLGTSTNMLWWLWNVNINQVFWSKHIVLCISLS